MYIIRLNARRGWDSYFKWFGGHCFELVDYIGHATVFEDTAVYDDLLKNQDWWLETCDGSSIELVVVD